jgi:hypothetical protein
VRGAIDVAVIVLLIGASILLGEAQPVHSLSTWIDAHELALAAGVGCVLALGLVLFLGGTTKLALERGEPLDRGDIEDVERSVRIAAQPVTSGQSSYRFIGHAEGRAGEETFSLRELKSAWHRGAVRSDRDWRRRAITLLGVLLLAAGICGAGVVLGPTWVKVLLSGALLYVYGRLAWGWFRRRSR